MKVLAINGSPNRQGNTSLLIKEVFNVLESKGIDCELYNIGGKLVHGCTACMLCKEKKDNRCHIKNDAINECIEKMNKADGIILGSPVYFSNITTEMKALIDCAGYVTRANGHTLARKVGAGIVAVRRAGEMSTFDAINHFFLINQMIVPGSSYWNIGIGRMPGDVLKDEDGIQTMRCVGENMAWLIKKINE